MEDEVLENLANYFASRTRHIRMNRMSCVAFILGTVVAASALLSACGGLGAAATVEESYITGSGKMVTRDFDLKDFTGLKIGSSFKVDVVRSDKFAVRVTADDNVINLVEVSEQGETLNIQMQSGAYRDVNYSAVVEMPSLNELTIKEASNCTLSGFESQGDVNLVLSGSSVLTGRIEAKSLSLDMIEATNATLGGTTSNLTVLGAGSSVAKLGDLNAGTADIQLRSASTATVSVENSLSADLRSSSHLYYFGNPTCDKKTVDSSSSMTRK
jgi:hypothetical protein